MTMERHTPLRRMSSLERGPGPKRRKPMAKVNHRRRPTEWSRAYGSVERVQWVQAQPSVASGEGPCVNAHVTPPEGLPAGMGRKHGYVWIVPITEREHAELHAWGEETWQKRKGVDLAETAAETHARWLEHCLAEGIEWGDEA